MSEKVETPRRLPMPSGPVLGLLGLLLLFVVMLWWRGQLGNYFSPNNLRQLFHDNAVTAVLALGLLLIIISGGIDLSVGSVVALVTVATVQTYRAVHDGPGGVLPAWGMDALRSARLDWSATRSPALASLAAVPAGLVTGTLCGLVNGLVVTRLRLTPFVATLGMVSLARGLAFWFSSRTPKPVPGERPGWVVALSRSSGDWLFFDPGVWSLFLLAALVALALRFTVFGRHVYAVGSNEATARLCGVGVDRVKVWVYVLAGLLAGWAGVLLFAQTDGGDPNLAQGRELEVIAAVVIGGASLSGGQGTVPGALLGVLIWGVLANGLGYIDVPVETKYILMGVIVVVNTALSRWQRTRGG